MLISGTEGLWGAPRGEHQQTDLRGQGSKNCGVEQLQQTQHHGMVYLSWVEVAGEHLQRWRSV